MNTASKVPLIQEVREAVGKNLPQVYETDESEVDMLAIHFGSSVHPDLYAYVCCDDAESGLHIDLENWGDNSEWDNAIARVDVNSVEDAVHIVAKWLLKGQSTISK